METRHIALMIVTSVLQAHQPLDTILEINKDFKHLEPRDKAFVRMLATTVLRHRGQIDAIIEKAQDKPGKIDPPLLQHILRIGVAQIAFMNVPDHAAVDTSVELAKGGGIHKTAGFINGVLRNVTRSYQEWMPQIDPVVANIPEWMLEQWIDDYGHQGAISIGNACLKEAPLDITVKNSDLLEEWSKKLDAKIMPTGTLRRSGGGSVTELQGFDDGMWWVQDLAASLPAKLFGDLTGKRVLDICAAPGGKTTQLAAMGADVVAVDRSAKRLERMRKNLKRMRLDHKVEIVTADAGVWTSPETFDAILLDVPCTATGTIRRNPDVMYMKTEYDCEKIVTVQRRLLENVVDMLNHGGTLIYCNCSLQKVEGEDQIDWLHGCGIPLVRRGIHPNELPGLEHIISKEGDVRTRPDYNFDDGGMDGFFITRLIRV